MKLKFRFPLFTIFFTILAFFPGRINSDLDSDKRALLQFAKSVPHLRKLNWNSKIPICKSWIGITCTKDKTRVLEFHLPAFGLYGSIPPNTIGKLENLRVLSLRSNNLYGYLPSDILSLPSLKSIYLQNNNLSGSIPLFLSPQITVLDLSFNALTGEIPSSIKNLTKLSILKLQFNSLQGSVANLNLPSLKLFNISYNLLNGSIPNSLENFPISSFIGNSDLCGSPLILCSASSSSSPSPSPKPSIFHSKIASNARKLKLALSIGGGLTLIVLLLTIFFLCRKRKDATAPASDLIKPAKASSIKKNENIKSDDFGSGVQEPEKNRLVFFEGCSYSFDLEDLLRASAEVLGKGSFGTAYKAIMDESTTVVVKRIKEVAVGKKEFEQHMETVNKLGSHPNVLPLLAYYYSKDEKLLVHEYMACSSLAAALHGHSSTNRPPLDWDSRLNISLGSAKGISHIHSQRFTHGNIKSSNVLLTQNTDPLISDYSLTPLINHGSIKYRVAGYRAPEVIESPQKVNQKSDVYSFGVLLLEILTGKSPMQNSGYNDHVVDLPRWVRSVVREEWTAEVFDVELMKYTNIEEELVQMLQIALTCVNKVPEMRPEMDEVVKMIRDIREGENRLSSEDNGSKDSNNQTP